MNTVAVTGPGTITTYGQDGGPNQWTFPVVVNGQAGVASVWSAYPFPSGAEAQPERRQDGRH
jgi:hypothetical protein